MRVPSSWRFLLFRLDFKRPARCRRQRTGREDRRSKFYEVSDNLATPAIGGQGATIAVKKKKLKRLIRNEVARQIGKATGPQGPQGSQGPQGQQGPSGQDATKLFGYIHDSGAASTATLQYGSGVTAVNDPSGASAYTVTFDRSLVNCVVQATAGVGDPSGTTPLAAGAYIPLVDMSAAAGSADVKVTFLNDQGVLVDTSFMITAFC